MAIRAYELALLHLRQCLPRLSASCQIADLIDLDEAGKVVPRHRGWMEEPSTVFARRRGFEFVVPLVEPPASLSDLVEPPFPIPRVVLVVVLLAARLAPDLPPIALVPAMKVVERLVEVTPGTTLHCHIRLQSVADGANNRDMAD
jgi:hypothetical protein